VSFASLTTPFDKMARHYDAVVIGSGYGAGIAACRLARAGLSVCMLERGKEYLPGDFPANLRQGYSEFQIDTRRGKTGSDLALFDLRANDDISVMVGCGLGGTSLINGNVMLRPENRVFGDPVWPQKFRHEVSTRLEEGYRRATRMLQPVPYSGSPALKKIAAFQASAKQLGAACTYPPINVTFEPGKNGNYAGVDQPACTLCGDCCSGCNVGAKNTVAMNYLPDAVHHGATVFTACKVSHIEKSGTNWNVVFTRSGKSDGRQHGVTARFVVAGAGTLGSTEILLRSQQNGLALSAQTGRNFSGNGDVIAFGYNNDVPINAIGIGHPVLEGCDPVGPVIAGLIDLRKDGLLDDNMVIQEGAIPSLLAPLLPGLMAGISPLFGDDTDEGDHFDETKRTIKSIFKGAYRGAVHNTQTFLVMAHEGGGGVMSINKKGRLDLSWPDAGKRPVFEKISKTLRQATAATGGTYVDNPMWSKMLGRNLISVHPLGGCAMADDADKGTVDHKARVFDGEGSLHDGLYVMDGSIMPRSLGVNPSFTISATCERAMIHFSLDRGLSFNDNPVVPTS
jgi:cholesterol oxidase